MDQSTGAARTPLDVAVERAGGQAAMAVALNVTPQAVNQWVKKGVPPAERARDIEALTGVTRYELLPKVFGPAPVSPSAFPSLDLSGSAS